MENLILSQSIPIFFWKTNFLHLLEKGKMPLFRHDFCTVAVFLMLSRANKLIRALVGARIYVWKLYWFMFFLKELQKASLGRYEQPTLNL